MVPATGRALATLPPEVAQLPGVRYVLTTNGAAVWDLGSEPMSSVYSRYADAEKRQITQPVCLLQRLFPPQKAREVFGLCQQYEGELTVFSDGRAIKDRESQDLAAARMARHCSTEADQPYDGRFTVVPDLAEWMSREAHAIEKFCLFFGSAEKAQAALPAFRQLKGVEVVQGSRIMWRSLHKGWTRARRCWLWQTSWASPQRDHGGGRQRERPRTVGKSRCQRCHGQRYAVHQALADYVSQADCDADGVAELFEKLVLVR